jgi:hypothetical protein
VAVPGVADLRVLVAYDVLKRGMRKHLLILGLLLVVASVTACDLYSDYVLDNREHGLPCVKLPTHAAAEAILAAHGDVIDRIKRLGPEGSVIVELAEPCPGKADLVIYHPTHAVRKQIEELIGSETFYGLPYRLINV